MSMVILSARSRALGREREKLWRRAVPSLEIKNGGRRCPPAASSRGPRVQSTSRPGIILAVALLLVVTTTLAVPASALGVRRIGIDEFMTGLACVESGGRFNAFNPGSRSYGKFQVMPHNWSA